MYKRQVLAARAARAGRFEQAAQLVVAAKATAAANASHAAQMATFTAAVHEVQATREATVEAGRELYHSAGALAAQALRAAAPAAAVAVAAELAAELGLGERDERGPGAGGCGAEARHDG